jgi:hypothetical protein
MRAARFPVPKLGKPTERPSDYSDIDIETSPNKIRNVTTVDELAMVAHNEAEWKVLRDLDLEISQISNAIRRSVFMRCTIRGAPVASFENCSFHACDISNMSIATAGNCRFYRCNAARANFYGQLTSSHFQACNLSESNFRFAEVRNVLIDECLVTGMVLDNSKVHGLKLKRPIGAETLVGIPRSLSPEDDSIDEPELDLIDRLMTWDRLRFVRTLKLFAVSYTAIIFTPLILLFIEIWNYSLSLGQAALKELDHGDSLYKILNRVIHGIPNLSVPGNTALFFVGSCLLALASTLFVLACPARVREFGPQQWQDEIRGSPLSYMPYTWSRKVLRVLVWLLLIAGGALAGSVVLLKVGQAVAFLLEHGTFLSADAGLAP